MPWGRIDDTYYDHPKLEAIAGESEWPDRLAAAGLNALAWSWCNRFLTDGHVPTNTVVKLGGQIELARILVASGLWEETATGYLIHDFLDFNDSREQVQARRKKEADRKAAWRMSHRDTSGEKPGPNGTDHGTASVVRVDVPASVPPSVPAGQADVSRDSTRARRVARIPSRPVPSDSDSPPNPPRARGGRRSGSSTQTDYDALAIRDSDRDDEAEPEADIDFTSAGVRS